MCQIDVDEGVFQCRKFFLAAYGIKFLQFFQGDCVLVFLGVEVFVKVR